MRRNLSGIISIFFFVCFVFPANTFSLDQPWDTGHNTTELTPRRPIICPSGICPVRGSPVHIKDGNYFYSIQDLYIPGRGFPLEVTRRYDSQDLYDGPFGHGWKFNYDIRLTETTDETGAYVNIRRGDGVRLVFTENPDGTYALPQGRRDYVAKYNDNTFQWCPSGCASVCGNVDTCYYFDTNGLLTKIQDPYNNQISFGYDTLGRLTQITDPSGRHLDLSYGTKNKVILITDPANRLFRYGYDIQGNLTAYTNPLGNTATYSYDNQHNLIGITDPEGNAATTITYDSNDRVRTYSRYAGTWTYSYDPPNNTTYKDDLDGNRWTYRYTKDGQLLSKKDPFGNTKTYTWDDTPNLTSVSDARGNMTTFLYDNRGNRIAATDAYGNTTTCSYHPVLNKLTSIADPLGRTTSYQFDEHGNLVKMMDALGNQVSLTFNQYGQLATITDPLGHVTVHTYDLYGNLVAITDPLGNMTTMTYDIVGNLTKITNAGGHSTSFVYDAMHNRVAKIDALGHTTLYDYDKNSNLVRLTDADGHTTRITYTRYNQLNTITDPLSNSISLTYNKRGYPEAMIDANGNTSRNEYDVIGRIVKLTDASGNSIQYGYDSNGNLTSIKDGKGNITTYTYDNRNYLSRIVFPDSTYKELTYDKVGNLFSKKDCDGNTFTYAYDSLDRLVTKTYPDGSKVNYAYDASSNLISAANNHSTVSFAYDDLLRITRVDQNGRPVLYEYDAVGNRTKVTYPGGTSMTYEYNPLGLLERMRDASGQVIASYSYDPLRRKTQQDLRNGTQTVFEYNEAGGLTQIINRRSLSQEVISHFSYAYDKMGNRTRMDTESGTHTYVYDQRYQLTGATYPAQYPFPDTTYQYDANGNRTSTYRGTSTTYTTNSMNQCTSVGGTPYTYDPNGNLLSDYSNTYHYDYENQLTEATTPAETITYTYDAFGRKISKEINGSIHSYVYDGGHLIEDIADSGESTHYLYGPEIDQVLSMNRSDRATPYYYHLDGLGSVRDITDSGANRVESYAYDIYGKPSITNPTGNTIPESMSGNSYMFTARALDKETGLYDYRARHYDPNIGRFLQEDPQASPMDMNLYTYVGNNPVNFTDPAGTNPLVGAFAAILIIGFVWYVVHGYRDINQIEERQRKEPDLDAAWAGQQKIREDVLSDFNSKEQEELLKIQDLINRSYKDIKNQQCDYGAMKGVQLIVESLKLQNVKVGGFTPDCGRNNFVEIISNRKDVATVVTIYLGPPFRNEDGEHPLYSVDVRRTDGNSKVMVDDVKTYLYWLMVHPPKETPWGNIYHRQPTQAELQDYLRSGTKGWPKFWGGNGPGPAGK